VSRLLAAACLALALTTQAVPAAAGPRDDALSALQDRDDLQARRQAVRTLMQAGTMADMPPLVKALRDPDHMVRMGAEQALWDIWSRSGNQDISRLLERGVHAMTQGEWDDAIADFTAIINRDPGFAEGWNKRATAYFLKRDFQQSLADCDEVIKRNPYHFGALSGYGMIYVELDQPARALEYFERALAVNPNMDGVRDAANSLRELLIRQRKDSI
jgi:tetratricopeptide (TPR) repeat protein